LILSSIFCFMNKDELRKIYLHRRQSLSEIECQELSLKISELFFQSFDLSQIHILHTYLPIESKREPNTWFIINRIQREFPRIQLVIPKVKGETMEHVFYEGSDQLELTKWGMTEPKHGEKVLPDNIDAVIVPLLLFDDSGHRLGYGKGFYDRFLGRCRLDCKKIGLSFFDHESQIKTINHFDVPLTHCITPSRVYQFKTH
jgi:5-formyltetrahydrofolate cyclo-ligase